MSVKRLTIELDDVTDISHSTTSPPTLMPRQTISRRREETDLPSKQADYQESDVIPRLEHDHKSEVVGRTPADLVVAFMNKPEFMVTLFVFLSFLISVARIQHLSDLWITLSIALGLNIAWFGIIGIRVLYVRIRK